MRVLPSHKVRTELTPPHRVELKNGKLIQHRYRIHEKEYSFHNKAMTQIEDLFLEHKFNKSRELVETSPPLSKTDNFYRFCFTLKPNSITLFSVKVSLQPKLILHLLK